jgi:hypothetical protein
LAGCTVHGNSLEGQEHNWIRPNITKGARVANIFCLGSGPMEDSPTSPGEDKDDIGSVGEAIRTHGPLYLSSIRSSLQDSLILSHPFLRTKIGCIKYSCAPQVMIAHISRQITKYHHSAYYITNICLKHSLEQ